MAAHFTRNETVYSVVYGNGVMKETDPFTADEAEFLYADEMILLQPLKTVRLLWSLRLPR